MIYNPSVEFGDLLEKNKCATHLKYKTDVSMIPDYVLNITCIKS